MVNKDVCIKLLMEAQTSSRTNVLNPQLVLKTGFPSETRVVLEVLQ